MTMIDTSIRSAVAASPAELDELSAGSVVQLNGMRKPIYRECTGDWMSTHVPGKPVYDYACDSDYFPAQILFRADPLEI